MEATLFNIFLKYGVEGLIIGYLLWDKFIKPMDKKKRGEWVSYKDIEQFRKKLDIVDDRFNYHMQKESECQNKIERLEVIQMHQSEEIKHIFDRETSMLARIDDMGKDLKQLLIIMSELKRRNG